MSEYITPLKDMQFVIQELAGIDAVALLPGFEDINAELVDAILVEAGKFATGVLSPINGSGDREGARWSDGEVRTANGWAKAYAEFIASGWNALSCATSHGGQGLPRLVSALVEEIWNGANVSFALCPMLTRGAIEALDLCGSEAQKALYMRKMISGEWTGTMNLTEPQAGSDLSAVRTRAVPHTDGSYRLHGQKIFITYGEHDLTDNIVHLVLARTPDAPPGVKGISLFVVPKFLVNEDGSLGPRNDVRCVSIEHKLGIHASPTAVLAFGDHTGAVGWLVGEENHGLDSMFVMMNAARFSVGLEGIGLSERAYQQALAYARMRIQGVETGGTSRDKVTLIQHPDVRRMLLQMKSRTEALRAVACVVAAAMDAAAAHPNEALSTQNQAFVDLMIPIVKGWSTETSVLVTSLGIQIHGGVGFVEETGAAQHFRDARITPIYEGTTGIQAADLIGRKIARDDGKTIAWVANQIGEVQAQLVQKGDEQLARIGAALAAALEALQKSVAFIRATYFHDVKHALAGSVPFLELFGIVVGGWQMARAALIAHERLAEGSADVDFFKAKLITTSFYADHVLSAAPGLAHTVIHGAEAVLALTEEQF